MSLDPANWDDFRRLAHRMVDHTLDHLQGLSDAPAWQAMPDEVAASFQAPLPRAGEGEEAAFNAFLERVRPYPSGNLHPRFFGWVQGNGTAFAALCDMLASALNAHMAGFNHAPKLVEMEVIRWLAEAMGFPEDASGLLVTGGSMANTLALATALRTKAPFDARADGLRAGPELTLYGSDETHGWARKAVELLGLGDRAFRRIPSDAAFRVDVAAMRAAIQEDRAAGRVPFCILGTAGTVNTGASDDLAALADLAAEEDLWFHVDGAFGAWAWTSEALRPQVAGMERADSLAFDVHKWGSMPFDCACVLVRDAAAHRQAFAAPAAYLTPYERGVMAGGLPFADRGVDLTRNFKALKVWMSLKAYGMDRFVEAVERNVDQARHVAGRVDGHADLERLAPAPLNIVCFRYRPSGAALSEAELDELNREILLQLQEKGIAVPSSTRLDGRYAIRAAFVGHRTTLADADALIDGVLALGAAIMEEAA